MSTKTLQQFGVIGGGIYFTILSITQPYFSLYAAELGASTALIGLMVTIRALLPFIIALPVGGWIDRFGATLILKMGCVILLSSLLLMIWSPNMTVLTLSQLFIGASTVLVASSLQVIVTQGDQKVRDQNINRYSVWSSAGTMVGPLIGGGLLTLMGSTVLGYKTVFFLSFMMAAAYFIVFRWKTKNMVTESKLDRTFLKEAFAPKQMAGSYLGGLHLTRNVGVQFGLTGTFLIHFIQNAWMSFFPLFMSSLGYTEFVIALLISWRGMSAMIARIFLGSIMKVFSKETILTLVGVMAGLGVFVMPFSASYLPLLIFLTFIIGFMMGINMPISTMIMVDASASNDRGKVMSLRLLTNRFSQLASPVLFGAVGQWAGLGFAFSAGGAFLITTTLGYGGYYHYYVKPKTTGREKHLEKMP